jgi:phosphoserine phosphatase
MPILDPNVKAAHLAHYCKQNGVDPIDAATIGDGANNLAVLQATGMGVAFEGKPLLLAKMATYVKHTDLPGLRYLQGYKEHDFIANKI